MYENKKSRRQENRPLVSQKFRNDSVAKQITSELQNPEGNAWVGEMNAQLETVEKATAEVRNATKISQNPILQSSAEGGIINQETDGGDNDVISNQGAINGSSQERKTSATRETAESQRITEEDSVTFQRRIGTVLDGAGQTISRNGTTLAFIPKTADNTEGGKAYNILKNNGYNVVYCEGTIYRNDGNVTIASNEALTTPNGTVYISSNATLAGVELALHESVHIAQNTNNRAFAEYESVLSECLDITSENYDSIAELINKNNFGGKYDIEDINSWKPIMKELSAYINQYVMTDIEHAEYLFGGMFNDWNAVVDAVKKFNNDIGLDLTKATSENEAASFLPESDSENDNLQSGASLDDILDESGKNERPVFREAGAIEIEREETQEQKMNTLLGRHESIKQRQIKAVAEKFGIKIKWDTEVSAGYYDPDTKTIAMNPVWTLTESYYVLFKHEFVHYLENRKGYESFKKYLTNQSKAFDEYVRNKIYEKTGTAFEGTREEALEAYAKIVLEERKAAAEIPEGIW